MLLHSRWVRVITATVVFASPATLLCQWQSNAGPDAAAIGASVGSDVERYTRSLMIAGVVRPVAWGARPFGPADLGEMLNQPGVAAHPWQAALRRTLAPAVRSGIVIFSGVNTGFPWGANDGALWQGRGVTAALGGAVALRWKAISVVAAPVAFWSQNASFRLMPTRATGISPYADPIYGTTVDLPQRMGASTYARFDPGESTVRLRLPVVTFAISTASVGWGTGEAFPAILGANAGGFPHLRVETHGAGLRISRVANVRVSYVLGTVSQSPWSSVTGGKTFTDPANPGTERIATGLAVSIVPAFLPALEFGANRFYHTPSVAGSSKWNVWSRPFGGVFKRDVSGRSTTADPTADSDNQLASAFARWVFPRRGIEASLELFREDHNWDARDLAQEPENNSAVLGSVRAIMRRTTAELSVLSLEYFDGDIRPIAQNRAQGFLYQHSVMRQGHTSRGQLLGAPLGVGAIAGARIGWERFRSTGSTRVALQRWRTRSLPTTDPEFLSRAVNYSVLNSHDWILDGSISLSRFGARGDARSVEAGVAWAGKWQLDRQATNLYARASWSLF